MFDESKIAADFSRAAGRYAQHAQLQFRIGEALVALASPHISAQAALLDVGAGTGEVTQLWPCARKLAVDVAPGMVERARALGLDALGANACELPVAGNSIDAVASNVMLQWLSQPQLFLAEAARVLTPGGYIALSSFMAGTLSELAKAFNSVVGHAPVSPFLSQQALVEYVSRAGFEIVAQREDCYVEFYRDLDELLAYLRAIGAGNKLSQRKRGLLTPRQLGAVRAAYPLQAGGLAASWQVGMVVARKI